MRFLFERETAVTRWLLGSQVIPGQRQGVESESDQVESDFDGSVVMADLRASKERPSELREEDKEIEVRKRQRSINLIEFMVFGYWVWTVSVLDCDHCLYCCLSLQCNEELHRERVSLKWGDGNRGW